MTEFTSSTPATHDRSFGEALIALPGQYLRVLTRPSVKTFLSEKEDSSWGLVWFQMLALGIISILILVIASLIAPPDVSAAAHTSGLSIQTLRIITILTTAIVVFVLTPLSFLVAAGILYLIAKAFRGKGTYLQQLFVMLLFGVPLVLLSDLLALIPHIGTWLMWLPHVYSVILVVLATIAVHSQRKIQL